MPRGRIHRRRLRDSPDESRQQRLETLGPICRRGRAVDRIAVCVLRRRGAAEHDRADIALALIGEQRDESRRLADRYRQHAGGLRIERAQMPGGELTIAGVERVDSAHARYRLAELGPAGLNRLMKPIKSRP